MKEKQENPREAVRGNTDVNRASAHGDGHERGQGDRMGETEGERRELKQEYRPGERTHLSSHGPSSTLPNPQRQPEEENATEQSGGQGRGGGGQTSEHATH